MNSKANLKAAREAISTKNFNEAVKACNRVLLWESENYNAWVFLGVAYTGLEDDAEAEKSYRRAIEINPDQLLAWQGLVSFYEKRKRFEEMANTIQDILPKVAASGDGNRVADYLEKLIHVYENDEKNKDKYIHFLKMYLPGNPIYDLVKDTKSARQPADVLWTIVGLTEEDQARMIDSRVQSRRYNVNAGPLDQVRAEVEAEVYAESKLGEMYETLLHLAEQDGSDTRVLHLKLLEFWYKRLPGVSRKEQLCKDLLDLAQSLADQQVDASLPYEIIVEFTDAKSFDDYDTNLMNRLVEQYPETGLSKLIQGYRLYHGGHIDEAFDAFGEGLDIAPNSLFGYLCLCWIYYDSKEYETGLEYATKGRDLVRKRGKETSRLLTNMIMSMELCMAHCYRHMDTKYYPDAMGLYEKILACDANEIGALEGTGLILREEGRYDEALEHFEKVFNLEPERHIALAEIGWIYCQKGVYEKAINYISKAIESADQAIAEYYYRLGRVYWSMGDDYKSDTNYAFKYFIKAVKLDPQFPDGFTFLGHYYRSVQNDHVRAKKCYSKAYLLNPLDVDAAWHLSNYYIQDNELDEAETLFQQVTEISPKTGWAWRRLGFAKMNQDKYDEAITCFQKALRTDTSDVQCWEGLAESYAHEGRYVAALKAFGRATDLNPRSIHGNYAKALVRQKIGLLDEAVAGFRKTLKIAESQGKVDYVPALKGLADTFLEQAKEEIQLGFFGRAAETCGNVVKTCLRGLKQDIVVVGFWKLIGDACSVFRTIPTCLHLCAYTDLQETMRILLENGPSPHEQLKFPEADATVRSLETFLSLQAFDISPKKALDFIFSCATFAYKKALVLCRNHPMIAPGLWHDLALLYHWIGENGQASRPQEVADTAILCIRRAIKMEPTQYQFWNALGVISMQTSPKISQYALVKAMELNSRSAVPWTNYGFLCLAQKDYELANQAFETAHALDPEWISAWVGQAHVAALWGNEAAAIFQHAFESSNGSSLEASYGYAETVFSQLTTSDSSKDASIIISPAFALQKLTEQRLDNALALNLLGLLFERLGQFERASAAFLQAIEALDTQCKRGSLNDEEFNSRIAKVHANLGRTLCASGSFQAAIESYNRAIECGSGSLRVYCQLGAGIAYYFEEQLEESLAMFETALAETEGDTDLRLDVNVLLSQVLWALGGEEQRQVAKNQLFGSIADNPSYLPAIFSLCAMGLLENDETLANAALQELGKVPTDTVYKNDKEHWIPWLFSRYYLLQNEPRQAMRSLAKSVHQFPWMAGLWRRLASNALTLTGDSESCGAIQLSMTSAALALAAESKTESADAKAEAYELAARVYLINESDDEQQSRQKASRLAQRAAMMAPWRISAWQTLASA